MKHLLFLALLSFAFVFSVRAAEPPTVAETDDLLIASNGLIRIEMRKATGQIISLEAMVDGQLTKISDPASRNAFYIDWNGQPLVVPEGVTLARAGYGGPSVEKAWVVESNDAVVEITARNRPTERFPFAVEYHYRLPAGRPVMYAWAKYMHGPGMPGGQIDQTRFVFRGLPGTDLFTNHVVDEHRLGPFETSPVVETVQDATTLHENGLIHTKYDNCAFTADFVAHGLWGKKIGFWLLWPSVEFCNGGPMRQDLTVHPTNILLTMFQSRHYNAGPIVCEDDQVWTKLCGPVAFYVNHFDAVEPAFADAFEQARIEQAAWPYAWLKDADYPLERSTVRGRVKVEGKSISTQTWAVLSPDESIDWALSANGYQFFARVETDGTFEINNVRPGHYKLTISGADEPIDFNTTLDLPAGKVDLGEIHWTPKRNGKLVWQVGTFDRGTREFVDGDNPRNYARFLDYFKRFPDDVNFVIGRSRPERDWYYAQWNWFSKTPRRTIEFDYTGERTGTATLTVGIASREFASEQLVSDVGERALSSGSLIVRLNGEPIAEFTGPKTGAAGYRSASQDSVYVLETVTFDAYRLKPGTNQVSFEHAVSRPFPESPEELKRLKRPRGSVMYDAIRLEVAP